MSRRLLARLPPRAGTASLINTLRGISQHPPGARGSGGLSGPALKPVALYAVSVCHEATGLPIVGLGGIESGRDAVLSSPPAERATSRRTVLFADPGAPVRVRASLPRHVTARLAFSGQERAWNPNPCAKVPA